MLSELELLQWKHLELLRELQRHQIDAMYGNGRWAVALPAPTFMGYGNCHPRIGETPVLCFTSDGGATLREYVTSTRYRHA